MNKKIMIVDDDEKIVCAISVRLKAAGYDVLSAFDPIRGMSMILDEKPDLLLLDLTMPGGGGLKLAERLRAIPEHLATPIIVITANKQLEPRFEAEELGVEHFIEKPFESQCLLSAIESSLSH